MLPLLLGKSNNCYTLWVCVCSLSYPAWNARAPCCHLWPAPLYHIFLHYLTRWMIFEKEKKVQNTKCVFRLPLQFLCETFLILRRLQRDVIKLCIVLHVNSCKFLLDFNETWIFWTDFRQKVVLNFVNVLPVGTERFHVEGWTDRRTDEEADVTKVNVVFCNFSNACVNGWAT